MTRQRITTDAGIEIQCTNCKDFWPETSEFFFFSKGKPHSWCKACYRADPKIAAKDQRWRDKVRKSIAEPKAPQFVFTPLLEAMQAARGAP